jgi:hypothetical protein
VGSQNLTLTAGIAVGATSATLTTPWTYLTCQQFVNFSDGEQREVTFTQGSANISWTVPTTGVSTTAISSLGIQYYNIPATNSKFNNVTINVGQLKFQTVPVMSRVEWDTINFLPYNSDIPQKHFIYNGKLGIFPIPSTTGNVITFNYKTRVPDLTFDDYSAGTLAPGGMTSGSTSVTGLATAWDTEYPVGVDISAYNLMLRVNPPYGDGIWYPIQQVNSATSLTLALPVVSAPNITASATYTIGQVPILDEDFHDMLVYGSLMVYFSTIVKDTEKFKMYENLYNQKLEILKAYDGTKYTNVDLEAEPNQINPNLFIYAPN